MLSGILSNFLGSSTITTKHSSTSKQTIITFKDKSRKIDRILDAFTVTTSILRGRHAVATINVHDQEIADISVQLQYRAKRPLITQVTIQGVQIKGTWFSGSSDIPMTVNTPLG